MTRSLKLRSDILVTFTFYLLACYNYKQFLQLKSSPDFLLVFIILLHRLNSTVNFSKRSSLRNFTKKKRNVLNAISKQNSREQQGTGRMSKTSSTSHPHLIHFWARKKSRVLPTHRGALCSDTGLGAEEQGSLPGRSHDCSDSSSILPFRSSL